MARLHVGPVHLRGDIGKLAKKFDMVELRLSPTTMPKAATLRGWRKAVKPGFGFSVLLPPIVGQLTMSREMHDTLKTTLAAATTIQARCIVLSTAATVRPTHANIDKMRRVVAEIAHPSVVVCWEPHGIWERSEIASVAKQLDLMPVVDAAQEPIFPGSFAYTRLRSLGSSAEVGVRALGRISEQLRGRREAWVVVENPASALRVRTALVRSVGEHATKDAPIIVRPSPGRMRAEDEEQ